jgi:hypothetical protein
MQRLWRKAEMLKACQRGPNTLKLALGLSAIAIVFCLTYIYALNAYQIESQDLATLFQTGDENISNRVDVDARIVSIDPLRGEAKILLSLFPVDGSGMIATCNRSLKLLFPGATLSSGSGDREFPRNTFLNPILLSYDLEGQASDYPFDEHSSVLTFSLAFVDTGSPVPSVLTVRGHIPGYHVDLEEVKSISPGARVLYMTIGRSSTVIRAAMAGVVVMWGIGLAVLILMFLMLSGWYDIHMPSLFAALLFGLFSLRNSLPGTPPIGTFSDFLAFLWVQGIVAMALVVSLVNTARYKKGS